MRLLVLQDADWQQKGPHHQHHLMEVLSKKGHDIVVVGFNQLWRNDKSGIISEEKVVNNVSRFYNGSKVTFVQPSFIKIPLLDYASFTITARKAINELTENFKPDIIISFTSIITSYWGMRIAQKKKIPYIYFWTDVIHTLIPFEFLKPIATIIEKKTIEGSDKVISINEMLMDVTHTLGANGSQTLIIPGGIDLNRFDPTIDSASVKRKYGIQEGDTVLFFMGWLYEFSGLKEVIVELSKEKELNVKLLIVGEGDYYNPLVKLTEDLEIQDKVIFTGWQPYDEIPKLIASADICLLPAYNNEVMRDIVPIKLYEYLAMLKPVFVTKLPGVMKEFGDNSGLIYIESPDQVINVLKSLDPQTVLDAKEHARVFIKKYDWAVITAQFEDLLIKSIQKVI